jgi:hypothetical protein
MPSDSDDDDDDARADALEDDASLSPLARGGDGARDGARAKTDAIAATSTGTGRRGGARATPSARKRAGRGREAASADAKRAKPATEGDGSDSEDWLKNAMRARGLATTSGGRKTSARTPKKRASGGGEVVKGSFDYLLAEKAVLEAGVKRDAETRERRRLDDENLEARRLEEAAAMKREAEMDEAAALKALDSHEEFLDAHGEAFELRYDAETLGANAFASSRSSAATTSSESDAKVLGQCASKALRAVVKRGLESVSSAREEDLWRVLLLERWLPMRWASAKRACDEHTMEWLWDVATTCSRHDVRLAARDSFLAALGFDCKWGSLYDAREQRYDYRLGAPADGRSQCPPPAWVLCASTVCDTLRTFGARDYVNSQRSSLSAPATPANEDDALCLRPELFVVAEMVTAVCDNAFARNVEAFDNVDGCARILQMFVSIAIDYRAQALGWVLQDAAAALLASVPQKSWDTFKSKAIRYLLEISSNIDSNATEEDEYANVGVYARVVQWLPNLTSRDRDLRDALAAASAVSIRHLLPFAKSTASVGKKPKRITPAELMKIIPKLARDDAQSVIARRRAAMEHLSDVVVRQDTPAKEVWSVIVCMDLVDVTLNGGRVVDAEENDPEGGLQLFTRFLSRKVSKSNRRSLGELRTKLFSMGTRYERAVKEHDKRAVARKESIYAVD